MSSTPCRCCGCSRAIFPKAGFIGGWTASLKSLLEEDRDLAGVIPFERRRWAAPRRWPEMLSSLQDMRAKRFDWAIDLQGLARSGIFAWLANAGLTIGLDNAARRLPRRGARVL